MDELPAENREFVFGFEESYGYSWHRGQGQDAVLANLDREWQLSPGSGPTLADRLEELFAEHGWYLQDLSPYLCYQRGRAFQAVRQPLKSSPLPP